ncbi:MAG: copper resistance protein CopC [Burkholderiales bacterium]
MRITASIAALILGLAWTGVALAHAMPDHSSPPADATLSTAPTQVKVWFNGQIEPVFSTLIVKNAAGKQVSVDKGSVDSDNHTLLETSLPAALPAGRYKVYWSVVAHDGHHSAGDFAFTVK